MANKIGMLWYHADDKGDMSIRIESAVHHFIIQHGYIPSLCLVGAHSALADVPSTVDYNGNTIAVKVASNILAGHLWVA